MPDIVRKDDEVVADVERLAGPVELVGELRAKELLAVAAGAVEHHHRIVDLSRRIAVRLTEGGVMHPKLRQALAVAEAEVLEHHVMLLRRPGLRRRSSRLGGKGG